MQKTTKWTFLLFVLMAVLIIAVNQQSVKADNESAPGTIIKGKGLSTLYYLGEDGQRYVFPNAKIYFSWHDDFSEVEEIDMDDLASYPLGGNVHYKPGALLIKIQTDPKVYAVGKNGLLHWVKTEWLARKFYGANWNMLIDDVPDSLFVNYTVGDPIEDGDEYDPDEEEDNNPTVGDDLGLKKQNKIIKKIMSKKKKRCQWLEKSIGKIQRRMDRWGMEAPELGEDYLSECISAEEGDTGEGDGEGADASDASEKGKVTLCHIPPGNPDAAHTITVGKPAAKTHLARGDTLGACPSEEPGNGEEPEDTTPPELSDIEASVTTTTAVITWTTDEDSDSEAEYATDSLATASTTTTAIDETSTTSHSVELTGLSASTTYYFVVKSTDASDNQAVSAETTFTTLVEEAEEPEDTTAPVISDIEVEAQATSTTISWTTDEDSTSKVVYATEPIATASTTESVIDETMIVSHALVITDLATSTEYYYYLESQDEAGNIASSSEETFTTL